MMTGAYTAMVLLKGELSFARGGFIDLATEGAPASLAYLFKLLRLG
jgi:hypothetical protein